MDLVWMRHEYPELRHGPVIAVADSDVNRFRDSLRERGFDVVIVDGTLIRDEPAFWDEINTAFDFPDYQGQNWDAFADSFGDRLRTRHCAVIWRRADLIAAADLKLLADAIAVLSQIAYQVAPRAEDTEPVGTQLEMVISGVGPAFPPMG